MAAQWLTNLLGGGLVKIGEGVAGIVDKFKMTPDEKASFQLEMEKLLQTQGSELEQTIRAELGAKERILVAELSQGDSYTKRARPTVVYAGLAFIGLNYVFIPTMMWFAANIAQVPMAEFPPLDLPEEFWYGWSGIVATWSVGRSMERRGASNNLINVITGNKPEKGKKLPSLLE